MGSRYGGPLPRHVRDRHLGREKRSPLPGSRSSRCQTALLLFLSGILRVRVRGQSSTPRIYSISEPKSDGGLFLPHLRRSERTVEHYSGGASLSGGLLRICNG